MDLFVFKFNLILMIFFLCGRLPGQFQTLLLPVVGSEKADSKVEDKRYVTALHIHKIKLIWGFIYM
jgi:hypothetical protein